MLANAYEEFRYKFVTWALAQPDIRAAHLTGSYAQGEADPEWSDLDIEFYTSRARHYRIQQDWLTALAPVWIVGPDDRGEDLVFWRAWWVKSWALFVTFEPGIAVDFTIRRLRTIHWRRNLAPVSNILLDKDGLLERWGAPVKFPQPTQPPTQGEWEWSMLEFWGVADRAFRKLRRGDLMEAKHLIDGGLKRQLLAVIDWHTRAHKGWDFPTKWRGRDLQHWADPRIVAVLSSIYAHYDPEDMQRALLNTMDLFRWVAQETALHLDYAYPTDVDDKVTNWIRSNI